MVRSLAQPWRSEHGVEEKSSLPVRMTTAQGLCRLCLRCLIAYQAGPQIRWPMGAIQKAGRQPSADTYMGAARHAINEGLSATPSLLPPVTTSSHWLLPEEQTPQLSPAHLGPPKSPGKQLLCSEVGQLL